MPVHLQKQMMKGYPHYNGQEEKGARESERWFREQKILLCKPNHTSSGSRTDIRSQMWWHLESQQSCGKTGDRQENWAEPCGPISLVCIITAAGKNKRDPASKQRHKIGVLAGIMSTQAKVICGGSLN